MKTQLNKTLIASSIILAGFGINHAQAVATAYSYNDVSNFVMSSDVAFSILNTSTASQSSAQLNAASAGGGDLLNAPPSCVGDCPQPDNVWGMVAGNIAHGDAVIINPDVINGGQAINEALVNLIGGTQFGASSGSNSLNALIEMSLDGTLFFNMTSDPWLYVLTTEADETADANLDFLITLTNEGDTSISYTWLPSEMNEGRSQLEPGTKEYGDGIGGDTVSLAWSQALTAGKWTVNVQMGERANATTVPEPASLALLAGGLLGLGFLRRRFHAA
jgi:hypothetical protein